MCYCWVAASLPQAEGTIAINQFFVQIRGISIRRGAAAPINPIRKSAPARRPASAGPGLVNRI